MKQEKNGTMSGQETEDPVLPVRDVLEECGRRRIDVYLDGRKRNPKNIYNRVIVRDDYMWDYDLDERGNWKEVRVNRIKSR